MELQRTEKEFPKIPCLQNKYRKSCTHRTSICQTDKCLNARGNNYKLLEISSARYKIWYICICMY